LIQESNDSRDYHELFYTICTPPTRPKVRYESRKAEFESTIKEDSFSLFNYN
jgi:hypothetical protein